MRKSHLMLAGTSLGLLSSTAGWAQTTQTPAPQAQQQESQTPATAETTAAAPAAEAEAEIIVTAQRREQRLQDVPVSVSVVTGETLKNAVITNADRLEQIVPGIRMGRSGSELRPAIRGTYTEIVSANGDPRIGIYTDDIYQSRTSQVPPIVDLNRVEVQKGPQGTLYGRNSFGGNIAFFSALPKDRLEYSGDALISSDQRRVEGMLNLPIGDGLAFRVAGVYDDLRPYVENIGTGNDLGGTMQKFIRGTLRFQPPALDQLEIVFRASSLDIGGSGGGGFGYKFRGVEVDQSLITAPGGSITVNGINYLLPNGFNGNSFTGTYAPYDTRFRDGIPDINGADIGIPIIDDPYKVDYAGDFVQDGSQVQVGGTINLDIGPVRLRSISSYTDFKLLRSAGTLLPVLLNYSDLETTAKTTTQELQVLSNRKDDPLQWIVGFYYLKDDVREHNVTDINRSYITATAPAGQQYYPFGFTLLPTGTGFDQRFGFDSFSAQQQKTKSHALYGQLSYTFAERLTLTGGIRRTTDKKQVGSTRFTPGNPLGPTGSVNYFEHDLDDPVNFSCNGFTAANSSSVVVNTAAIQKAYQLICNKRTDKFTTYRAAADFKITRDNMVYASYSTGAHSGGFNTGVVTISGTPTLLGFEPEIVKAYEIGTKNSFLDRRLTLNAALFYNKYTDLHAQTSIPNPNDPLTVIALVQNIGEDDAYGVDLEATFRPTERLKLNAAFNRLHAREREYAVNVFNFGGTASFCGITPSCVASTGEANTVQGTPFPNARTDPNRFVPILNASGNPIVDSNGVPQLRYVIAGEGLDGTRYVSKKAFSPDYTFQFGAGYDIPLGGGATLTPEVQFYWNSGYILSDLTPDFGQQPAYTKTDLRITYRSGDDRFRVQAFVNNVEDEAVITRAVYSNHRSQLATYGRPRTYGVSAGFRF